MQFFSKFVKIFDMDITEGLKVFSRLGDKAGLHNTLGMEFLSTPEPDTCMARLTIDSRHIQPFGYMSGGTSLALAETLTGVGSTALCPERKSMGMNVTCNHIRPVPEGCTVTAIARIAHNGRHSHIWNVELRDSDGSLVCQLCITNFVF